MVFGTSAENENPHDYYIPENIFYRLCMKAKNEVAEKFQAKVADFRQWVDENPDLFSKIKSVLVITMNDENPSE